MKTGSIFPYTIGYIISLFICSFGLIMFMLSSCTSSKPMENITINDVTSEKLSPTATDPAFLTPDSTQLKKFWFPPTKTPSIKIIYTPHKELYPTPSFKSFLLENALGTSDKWSNLGYSQNGSISIENNMLIMNITEPKVRMISQYSSSLPPMYYLSVQMKFNLCSNEDEAGVLINISSPNNLIRYGFSCDGKTQIVRLLDGKPITILPWQENSTLSYGAPSINTIGVWVDANQTLFYANDQWIYTFKEKNRSNTFIGVYGRSAEAKVLNVIFANMNVYKIEPN